MLTQGIEELIWRALTDSSFRDALLSSRRCEVLGTLGLTEAERRAVTAVEADTLESFAGALCSPAVVRSLAAT